MEQPGFWAVLPANVRYDKELTPNEKILYTEITAMTQSMFTESEQRNMLCA